MYIRWRAVGSAVFAAVLMAGLSRVDVSTARQETSAVRARSAAAETLHDALNTPGAVADTLRHAIRGGQILIIALPDSVGDTPVAGYSLRRAPALSWLAGRSFMWRTLPTDRGLQNVILTAELRDGWLETLVLKIEVQ